MREQMARTATGSSLSRRLACFALCLVTVPVGIAWRMAPLHLPPFAFKYGGSALWAAAVYWAIAFLFPRWRAVRLGIVAALVALIVELAKLIFWPPLDRFRETLAGKLLLGRYFTIGAIVAYWLTIALVALVDAEARPGLARNGRAGVPDVRTG